MFFHIKCGWDDKHWQPTMDKCACVVQGYLESHLDLLTIEYVELGAIVHNMDNIISKSVINFVGLVDE